MTTARARFRIPDHLKPSGTDQSVLPPHLNSPTRAAGREVSLVELSDRHICAALGKLVLTRSAWSCFSLHETSKLLRPLQINPELTGTSIHSPDSSAEIVYKFQSQTGKIGMVKGVISLEDFRGATLRSLYQLLNIHQAASVFMETVVPYVIDNLKLIFSREEDETLWREAVYFNVVEMRNSDFIVRGFVPEAIPRRFLAPLQRAYQIISNHSKNLPNIAFQVCLKAFFEYNEYPNSDLIALLLGKYFYTIHRYPELRDSTSPEHALASRLPVCRGFRSGGPRFSIPSRLLTLDNDSETSLEKAGISYQPIRIGGGSGNSTGQQMRVVNEMELDQLKKQLETAQAELKNTRRVVSSYQENEKQELIRRLKDVDKFLLFSLSSFFDTMMFRLPQEVIDVYGSAWIPRTSMIDEKHRQELQDYLAKVSHDSYLSKVSSTESSIISYWETLSDSFYDQWVTGQYQKLERFEIDSEEAGIQTLDRARFTFEVQLRFAARHQEIVRFNRAKITNILINHLAQRVAINTSQQSYTAMQAKLASVINMDISKTDVWELHHLIEIFTDRFMGKEEVIRSPYPVGTILEVFQDLQSQERDGRTRLGLEIMSQIYQEYML